MAYQPGERMQHYSNPDVTYNGIATGTESDNNARVIRRMISQVKNYREEVNYRYRIIDDEFVVITDCLKSASGTLRIPDLIEGKQVIEIQENAFKNCNELTEIIIPESIKIIGNSAFLGCTKLSRINIPDKVTSIGESAFSFCVNLKSIIVPDGVTSIKQKTFYGCESLNQINLPSLLQSIEAAAFEGTDLNRIVIPNSVKFIGSSVFFSCANLKNIVFLGDAPTKEGDIFDDVISNGSAVVMISPTSSGFGEYYENVKVVRDLTVFFTYEASGNSIVITDCNDEISGSLTIPTAIEGKPVVGIAPRAFSGCHSMVSITSHPLFLISEVMLSQNVII